MSATWHRHQLWRKQRQQSQATSSSTREERGHSRSRARSKLAAIWARVRNVSWFARRGQIADLAVSPRSQVIADLAVACLPGQQGSKVAPPIADLAVRCALHFRGHMERDLAGPRDGRKAAAWIERKEKPARRECREGSPERRLNPLPHTHTHTHTPASCLHFVHGGSGAPATAASPATHAVSAVRERGVSFERACFPSLSSVRWSVRVPRL